MSPWLRRPPDPRSVPTTTTITSSMHLVLLELLLVMPRVVRLLLLAAV